MRLQFSADRNSDRMPIGSFTLCAAAMLKAAVNVVLTAGSYTWAGSSAALVRHIIMTAEPGSYVAMGSDVFLVYSADTAPVVMFVFGEDSVTATVVGEQVMLGTPQSESSQSAAFIDEVFS